MDVRFRILSGTMDPELYKVVLQDERANRLPFQDDSIATAANTPLRVSAKEGAAPLETVRQMVLAGDLKLRDLVDVGAGWETVEDCLLLDEACEPHRLRAHQMSLLAPVAIGVLVLGVLVFLLS
jgi:hypothetical protein